MTDIQLHHGDCLEVLPTLPDCSVDSIVTDPPYELGFMGKKWDNSGIAYNPDLWAECLRVLKPGGHLLAFGGTRTYHRMAVAIEDAGFEIRDSLHWIYGSGFPKSLNVSKAIDKILGAERQVVGSRDVGPDMRGGNFENAEGRMVADITEPASDEAKQWDGWGSALKPAHEPIVVARKPLVGTVAGNVLQWGTGALNIDGTRVAGEERPTGLKKNGARSQKVSEGWDRPWKNDERAERVVGDGEPMTAAGRWPANIVFTHNHDCTDICTEGCPVRELDRQQEDVSRFFTVTEWDAPFRYVAKPGKRERNAGLDHLPPKFAPTMGNGIGGKEHDPETATPKTNVHPTVKPLALMRWLVRLVTPPGGTVLEPFAGSGTTLVACHMEGFNAIGIEMTDEYLPIIEGRLAWAKEHQAQQQLEL
jgi:site-specific DNA-methyltransferase (adenine-specific)